MNYDIFMVGGSISFMELLRYLANYDIFMVITSIIFYGCYEAFDDSSDRNSWRIG